MPGSQQDILQSDGIDFIHDLLYFLVLLLAFQRFELRDWGVIPKSNPLVHEPRPPLPTTNGADQSNGIGLDSKRVDGSRVQRKGHSYRRVSSQQEGSVRLLTGNGMIQMARRSLRRQRLARRKMK